MNRVLFAAAIAAASCIATHAGAVAINPHGMGQALIYPYYTVNKSQDTLVAVANVSDVGSVVRVRFNEGMNGRPVLEFNLFLAAHDVWTGAVSQTADMGGAKLVSHDHSCVFVTAADDDDLDTTGLPFVSGGYDGGSLPADGGPTSITRTREGSIEIISFGDIVPGSALDATTTPVPNGTPNDGVPECDPAVLGSFTADDLATPSNGLYGSAAIVDVGNGYFYTDPADALSGFTSRVLGDSGDNPLLSAANSADANVEGGAAAYVLGADGAPLRLDYANGIDAVSAIFMTSLIYNDYLVDPALGAKTDWVVTFPTKAFYVDPRFGGSPGLLFAESFRAPGVSPISIGINLFDQESYHPLAGCGFPECPSMGAPTLAFQTNVVTFLNQNQSISDVPDGLLGSSLGIYYASSDGTGIVRAGYAAYGNAGRASIDIKSGDGGHSLVGEANGILLSGEPQTAFMVYNIVNANAQPGKLANYGGAFAHHSSLECYDQRFDPPTMICN